MCFFGAGSRGRTDTVLLPSDFESDASANSTIPANVRTIARHAHYYSIEVLKNQYLFRKKIIFYCNFIFYMILYSSIGV